MKICKPINTPLVAHFKLFIDLLLKKSKDIEYISHVPYSNAVESIMYIMTWYFICYKHCKLLYDNPRKEHGEAMKWILHYWKATSIVGLVFDKSMAKHRDIVGYVDFEYASDPNKWSFLWLYFLFVILLLVGKWVLDYCCFINH